LADVVAYCPLDNPFGVAMGRRLFWRQPGLQRQSCDVTSGDEGSTDVQSEDRPTVVAATWISAANLSAVLGQPGPQRRLGCGSEGVCANADDTGFAIGSDFARLEEEVHAAQGPSSRAVGGAK
jgi:hypothetical protein